MSATRKKFDYFDENAKHKVAPRQILAGVFGTQDEFQGLTLILFSEHG
jgi:hypothetical protein